MKGLIIKSTGSWYIAKDKKNNIFNCRLKGKFRLDNLKLSNPVVTGDIVEFVKDKFQTNSYLINKIIKRNNYLIRKSSKKKFYGHIIASNIDQALLISTIKNPFVKSGFIDRFLLSCNAYEIPGIIIYNKNDILNELEKKKLNEVINNYKKIGFYSTSISAKFGNGIKDLKSLLKNKISLFMGNSGVGKSTLINKLCNKVNQKVSIISNKTKKGKHRTTFSEMFEINNKTKIIDSPGIKAFDLFNINRDEIKDYFPEFIRIKKNCKYYNCMHLKEPNCEIKNELDKSIWKRRYKSYLSIIEDYK